MQLPLREHSKTVKWNCFDDDDDDDDEAGYTLPYLKVNDFLEGEEGSK